MNKLARLSDVEMEIMQTIWGLATPVTVAQLLAIFKDSRDWKNSTISTMLDRIAAKGFICKKMEGKTNYYSAIASFADYQKQESRSIISSLYEGSVKNFMAAFADDGGMTDTDVKELREWFASNFSERGGDAK